MELRIWTIATVAGALLIFPQRNDAAVQAQAKDTTNEKGYDASVPWEKQIAPPLSAAPVEVSSKATVYIWGPKATRKFAKAPMTLVVS